MSVPPGVSAPNLRSLLRSPYNSSRVQTYIHERLTEEGVDFAIGASGGTGDYSGILCHLNEVLGTANMLVAEKIYEDMGEPARPIHFPKATGSGFDVYYTKEDQSRFAKILATIHLDISEAIYYILEEMERNVEIMYSTTNSQDERNAAYADFSTWNRGSAVLANLRRAVAAVQAAPQHPPTTDLPKYKQWSIEEVDNAAFKMIEWITDGTHVPVNTAQSTVVDLINSYRQAARRYIRTSTTSSQVDTYKAQYVRSMGNRQIDGAPIYRDGNGSVAFNGLTVTSSTVTFRVVNPTGNGVYLDDESPDNEHWTISYGDIVGATSDVMQHRIGTLTWKGDGTPPAGRWSVTVSTRNAVGPSRYTYSLRRR